MVSGRQRRRRLDTPLQGGDSCGSDHTLVDSGSAIDLASAAGLGGMASLDADEIRYKLKRSERITDADREMFYKLGIGYRI